MLVSSIEVVLPEQICNKVKQLLIYYKDRQCHQPFMVQLNNIIFPHSH